MKEIELRRLWGGVASIRKYIVDDCIKANQSIKVTVIGEKGFMVLTPKKLQSKQFQMVKTAFTSKFNKKKYELIDFAWKPEDEEPPQQGLGI